MHCCHSKPVTQQLAARKKQNSQPDIRLAVAWGSIVPMAKFCVFTSCLHCLSCCCKKSKRTVNKSHKPPQRFALCWLDFDTPALFPSPFVATIYKPSLVYLGFLTLPFSPYITTPSHTARFSTAPDCCLRQRVSRFFHKTTFFQVHFLSLIYNDDDCALHDIRADSTMMSPLLCDTAYLSVS